MSVDWWKHNRARHLDNGRKWRETNRGYYNEIQRNWRKRNKRLVSKYNRKASLRRLYGVTPEQYDEMLVEQGGCCALCERHHTELKRRMAVDHDHKTGKLRDLLCDSCNSALGNLRDSPELLRRAANYIECFKD